MKRLLKNSSIIPMDVEIILYGYDVLLQDGKIIKIDKNIEDNEAEIIDCTSKFVMPGLINMHTHCANSDMLPLFIANGITSARNVWGNNIMMDWAREVEAGTRLGPTIYNTSPLIDGVEYWAGAEIVKTIDDAEAAVKRAIIGGFRIIKTYPDIPREAFIRLMELSNELHIPVVGHANKFVTTQELIDLGYHGIEHASILPDNEVDIIRLAKSGVWNCPTLTIIKEIDKFKNKNATCEEHRYHKYANSIERKDWDGIVNMIKARKSDFNFEKIAARSKLFAQHSNQYTMGTDNGNPGVVAGFSDHDELELMEKYMELTPYQVLRAATVNGARDLGIYSKVSTVTEGKISDLLVLDSNPLELLSNTRKIAYVIKGDKCYDRVALDSMIQSVLDMDVKDIVFAISNEINEPEKK